MSSLTVFTAPKPFADPHIATIQRNAIRSWQHLGPQVNVILVGNESGMAEVAREFSVQHLPEVACNEKGTPLISSIFDLARQNSESPLLAYVNADILLMPDFLATARAVAEKASQFLVVGRRWNLDVREPLDFSPGWEARLRRRVDNEGKLHPPAGSDYFIFPRACFAYIPAFAIGRAGWDNWMIYEAHRQHWPVVDATSSIKIVHQNHDYSHLPGGTYYGIPETDENIRLAGGWLNTRFTLTDANFRYKNGRVRPAKWTLVRLIRLVELFILAHNDPPTRFRTVLFNRIYMWRVKIKM